MKNIEYVYDIRGQIAPIKNDDILGALLPYNPNVLRFEDEHYYNIPIHSLKIGHVLYGEDFETMKYYKVQLVHKYNGIHFFKWLEGPLEGKIEDIGTNCLFFMKELFPIKIIVPKGITLTCCCPKTEILYEYEGKAITQKREKTRI